MLKLGAAIDRVQSVYSRGVKATDSRVTSRHIYSALTSARGTLIQQQYDNNQKPGEWVYQVLPCVELIKAQIHECPCVPDEGCMVLRSKYKIPEVIGSASGSRIKSITSLDGDIRIDEVKFETSKFQKKGNRFTGNNPTAIIKGGYIFVTLRKHLKAITIIAPFADVVATRLFPSYCGCTDCECLDYREIDYPIDTHKETALIQIANTELIYLLASMKEDKSNNGSDDTGAIPTKQTL